MKQKSLHGVCQKCGEKYNREYQIFACPQCCQDILSLFNGHLSKWKAKKKAVLTKYETR